MSDVGSSLRGSQGGSDASGASRSRDVVSDESRDLMEQQNNGLQTALFGTLYTIAKEKVDTAPKWAILKLALDFLQLFMLILRPRYGWNIDEDFWLWRALSYVDWKNPIVQRGYGFYIAVVYVLATTLALSVALCVYVGYSFKTSNFRFVWPLKVLRLYVSVFFQFLYIASLSVFLVALDCRLWGYSKDVRGTLALFPETECLAMPHILHAAVALLSALVFLAISLAITVADFELDPLSKRLLAASHSWAELRFWLMKTTMTIITVLLAAYPKVQSVVMLLLSWLLVWSFIRLAPHLNQWINHVRTGLYGAICWAALMLVVLTYTDSQANGELMTVVMLAGLAPFAGVGFLLSWARWRITAVRALHKFRLSPPGTKPKRIYKFWDVAEVEVVARVCRNWDVLDDDAVDQDAVDLADKVVKAGMAMFPNDAHMLIVHSNLLIDVQNSYQTGYSQLQAAKKANPGWMEKFTIFVREQEHLHKAASAKSGGDAAMDLISYVEFQRNQRMVVQTHKNALYAVRDFWRHTLHNEVSFTSLSRCIAKIHRATTHADKMYRTTLERYPSNSKLFRLYGRYLEDVRNDPWRAAQYYSEAEKLEDADDSNNDNGNFSQEGGEGDDSMGTDQKNAAVIVINATGIMQMVNKNGYSMFGYKKGEMEGKNVSMLMPPPFNQRHNGYLAKYVATGQNTVLGNKVEIVGLHSERHVFPITLLVNKVSGTGPDSVFMGVIKSVEQDPEVVKAWVMPSGQIASLDVRFSDWFGKTPQDLIGKHISALAVEVDQMTKLLEHANVASIQDFAAGKVVMKHTHIIHKYFDPVDTDVGVKLGGSESQRILVYTFRRNQAEDYFMVTDKKGKIRYITSHLALMLGYDSQAIQQGTVNMDTLLPQPFAQLHQAWMKDMPPLPPSSSCRTGAVVCLSTANKVQIPVRIGIITREENDETIYIITVKKATYDEGLDERRLKIQLDNLGNVLAVGDSPSSLFGFKPQGMVGRSIAEFVDVMRFVGEKAGSEAATTHLLSVLMNRAMERPGLSYRVGVFPPMTETDRAALGSMATTMLAKQTRPAVMAFQVQEMEDQEIQVHVFLWRADMLTGVIEVDKDGIIQKPGDYPMQTTGLIFGLPDIAMTRMKLSKFVHLGSKTVQTLLEKDNAKKGAMKSHTVTTAKLGPVKKMWGTHGDGLDLQLTVQGVSKEGHGKRVFVMVHVHDAKKGNPEFSKLVLMQDDILKGIMGDGSGTSSGTAKKSSARVEAALHADADEADLLRLQEEEQAVDKKGGVKFAADHTSDHQSEDASSLDRGSDAQQEHADAEDMDEPVQYMPENVNRTADWVMSHGDKPEDGAHLRQLTHANDYHDVEEADHASSTRLSPGIVPAPRKPDVLASKAPAAGPGAGAKRVGTEDAASDDGGASQASGSEAEGSQVSGSQIGDSASQAGGDQADYRRGKRYKRLSKLLCGPNAQKSVNRFNLQALLAVGFLLGLHIVCFSMIITLLNAQKIKVAEQDAAGNSMLYMQNIVLMNEALSNAMTGRLNPNMYSKDQVPWILKQYTMWLNKFERVHEGVFLGFTKLRRLPNKFGLQQPWFSDIYNKSEWVDTRHPYLEIELSDLWQIGNELVASGREVVHNYARWHEDGIMLQDTREYQFIQRNAYVTFPEAYKESMYSLADQALASTQQFNHLQLALLVIEGLVLTAALAFYMHNLIRSVATQRYSLYAVFLFIPHGFSRALATKKVVVDDDSCADSDSDAGEKAAIANNTTNHATQATKGADEPAEGAIKLTVNSFAVGIQRTQHKTAHVSLKDRLVKVLFFWRAVNPSAKSGRRTLIRNGKDSVRLLVPFVFWSALMVWLYAYGMARLGQAAEPVVSVNAISFTRFRAASVTAQAHGLVSASTAEGQKERYNALVDNIVKLTGNYATLMYGWQPGANVHFAPVKNGVLFSFGDGLAHTAFRTYDCLRYDQSTCLPESHKYYEITHIGADAMLQRLVEEAQLLTKDAPADWNIQNSTRMEYAFSVGYFDLSDALERLNTVLSGYVLGLYEGVKMLHIIIFVLSWFFACAFVFLMLRPFAHAQLKESRQVAELLSQLPADLDVEGVLTRTLSMAGSGSKDISQEDLDKMNDTKVQQEVKGKKGLAVPEKNQHQQRMSDGGSVTSDG